MAESFKFELVSPERLLATLDATSAVVPGSEGDMTVMAMHAPVMTTVKPGVVSVTTTDGAVERYVIFGGFADVQADSCTVLAESAVHVDEIDRDALEQRIQNAREDIADAKDDHSRSRAEEYLHQLTTLHGALMPA
jgi:F-type H+-transporting ATPase subunit epsilon